MRRALSAVAALLLLTGCAAQAAAEPVTQWHSRATCTTNATGHCTQTFVHSLGAVPVVQVTPEGLTAITHTYQVTATSFRVRVMRSETQPWASRTVTLSLSAFLPATVPSVGPSASASVPATAPTTAPAGWPNETNTGVPAGTALRACDGNISQAGVTLDGCLFSGGVYLGPDADDVTIKRSKVIGRVNAGYGGAPGADGQRGLRLEDVEIDGEDSLANNESGIGDDNYTCIRCHVHRTGRGAAARFNVTIEDSYLHDFDHRAGDHESAIGSNGGANMTFRRNHLECGPTQFCSGALVVYNVSDPVDNVLVEGNLLQGGSYCAYAGSSVDPPGTNVRFVGNRFGKQFYPRCGFYGPVTHFRAGGGNVWQDNAWADGSGAVNP